MALEVQSSSNRAIPHFSKKLICTAFTPLNSLVRIRNISVGRRDDRQLHAVDSPGQFDQNHLEPLDNMYAGVKANFHMQATPRCCKASNQSLIACA